MSEKIYCNAIRIKESKFGMKVSIKVDEFKQFVDLHANDKGFVNLEIKKRKEPGKYGDTHYAELDTWKPNQQTNEQRPPLESSDWLQS